MAELPLSRIIVLDLTLHRLLFTAAVVAARGRGIGVKAHPLVAVPLDESAVVGGGGLRSDGGESAQDAHGNKESAHAGILSLRRP